jgi:hypothetical protein
MLQTTKPEERRPSASYRDLVRVGKKNTGRDLSDGKTWHQASMLDGVPVM